MKKGQVLKMNMDHYSKSVEFKSSEFRNLECKKYIFGIYGTHTVLRNLIKFELLATLLCFAFTLISKSWCSIYLHFVS